MPLGMIFISLFLFFSIFFLFEGQYLKKLWVIFSEIFSLDSVGDTFRENPFFYCYPPKRRRHGGPQKLFWGWGECGPQMCQGNEKS